MTQKGSPYRSPDHAMTKHIVASLGQGDEGSENGMFEDPLYSPLASMAWMLHVHADAGVLPPCNFKKDAIVRPSHGRPRSHRPIVRSSENVRVTTLPPPCSPSKQASQSLVAIEYLVREVPPPPLPPY
jgi:hypothetical protein